MSTSNSAPGKRDSFLRYATPLIIVIAVAMILAVGAYLVQFGLTPSDEQGTWGEFGDYFGGLFNPILGFVTIAALAYTLRQNQTLVRHSQAQEDLAREERQFVRSQDSLQAATAGLQAALDTLSGAGQDRIQWISGARLIGYVQRIVDAITEDVHREMFAIKREQARQQLFELLGYANPNITGSYFYCASGGTLDEAAKQSTQHGQLRAIPPSVLRQCWQFARYPEQFDDPLEVEQWNVEGDLPTALWPGLRSYLEHTRAYASHNGQLIPRASLQQGAGPTSSSPSPGAT